MADKKIETTQDETKQYIVVQIVKDSFINGIGKNGDQLISLFEINSIVEEKENA